MSDAQSTPKKERSKFPPLYWLVVMFEFFERGSYYGMMSVLSVYFTDHLDFAKEDVGIIKSTIQPLLYFLPIISGALADRFGYRKTLMVAFSLLGTGYFITAQMTTYTAVFLALVVMGIGAGTFKPVISGTIARCTDETNSTLGFGIFYWSINLGAFLFPLFLVPFLKNISWTWVIMASAIGTGAMLIPTALFFREPPLSEEEKSKVKDKPPLMQTLANAFEIIYSPFILLADWARRSGTGKGLTMVILAATLGYGGFDFMSDHTAETVITEGKGQGARKVFLTVGFDRKQSTLFRVTGGNDRFSLLIQSERAYHDSAAKALAEVKEKANVKTLTRGKLTKTVGKAASKPFLLLYIGLLFAFSLVILKTAPRMVNGRLGGILVTIFVLWGMLVLANQMFGLSSFATLLCSIIGVTLASLFAIKTTEPTEPEVKDLDEDAGGSPYRAPAKEVGPAGVTLSPRFVDHFKFLLMIFIYSGFWVLYFQMFDSVLWYVQAYVDASSLDAAVNSFLAIVGAPAVFKFDVEHVTVINAGTIILLQLLVSRIVEKTRALPTMIIGIAIATSGMAILAVDTSIWVLMAGITMFSIGEMTAHPKFISYVGQTAPKARVAMYMGYIFLYGVIGSSIGGVVGANLYVKFVDELNQPRTLWLIFTAIGLATIVGLLLYNKLLVPDKTAADSRK